MNDDSMFRGKESGTLTVGHETVTISRADGAAIKRALVEDLRRRTVGEVEDRDLLLTMTENVPAFIDPTGVLRIGAWILDSDAGKMILRYGMPAGERSTTAYVASLAHERRALWRVTSVRTEIIRAAP